MRTTRFPHRAAAPSGFTLIEVIIALSLSLLLVSAIYSAISLHFRYEQAGRERIDRSQLSLAILRRFSEDIGSVAFTPVTTTTDEDADASTSSTGTASTSGASTSGGSTASTSSSGTAATGGAGAATSSSGASGASTSGTGTGGSTATATGGGTGSSSGTAAVLTPTSLGIVGTADRLQLDISHPTREDFLPQASATQVATSTTSTLSENRRVTWAMVTPSTAAPGATGLQSLTVNPALARQVAERLRQAVETPDKTTKALPLDDASILAREVVKLEFRYYDGYGWTTEWDSVTQGRLPRAIEVTIGFLKQDYQKPGSLNLPESAVIVSVKHVIIVPASTPVTGEEI